MTPKKALLSGADYLVICRPITQAKSPVEILNKINNEIEDIVN
jgi:orotidine-5'-phosphate decarboxylase